MSEPAATPKPKKPTVKPTLLAGVDDHEKAVQEILEGQRPKPHSSAKLIRNAHKAVAEEATNMTEDEVAEEVAKTKKPKKGDAEEIDPDTFEHKLNDKEKAAFLKSLTAEERAALTPQLKQDPDYLVNAIIPAPTRAQTTYFLFTGALREQLKASNEKLGVAELAARAKTEWAALGKAGQAKYEKIREQQVAAHTVEAANYKINLQTQVKAIAYYSKKLGATIVGPVELAKQRKEALNNQGVAWKVHFAESVVKKMIAATPHFPSTYKRDVTQTIAAATEAFIVWVGQQLAIRVVRAGKKTVSPPFLKAFALEEPHRVFLSRMDPIQSLPSEAKKRETTKSASTKKPAETDKSQTKLKLSSGAKASAFDNMGDDVEVKAPSKGKKASAKKTASEDKSVEELLSDDETPKPKGRGRPKKTDEAAPTKKIQELFNKKTTADDAAAAKQIEEDEYAQAEADAKKAGKKSSAKKATKASVQDPLYIPDDVTGVPETELAALRKEKKQWAEVIEVHDVSGRSTEYHDASGEPLEGGQLAKYLKFKTAIAKVQNKSQTWLNAHADTKPTKSSSAKAVPSAGYEDDDEEADAKAKKRKQPTVTAKKTAAVMDDEDAEEVIEPPKKPRGSRKASKEDNEEVSIDAKKDKKSKKL